MAWCAGLDVHIRPAPLEEKGEFAWYRVPNGLPDWFALVICDGPPGTTEGGRYGLMPVMRERLTGSIIVLDDTNRTKEQAILNRWCSEFDVRVVDKNDTYTVLQA
jgi:hypothetical protein